MPTYQYACTECAEQHEVVQKFSDDPLTQCPACTGKLRKIFSAVGVVFKGSGFYRTDSRAKSSAAEAPRRSEDGPRSESGPKAEGASKSESSPKSDSGAADKPAKSAGSERIPAKKSGGESAA